MLTKYKNEMLTKYKNNCYFSTASKVLALIKSIMKQRLFFSLVAVLSLIIFSSHNLYIKLKSFHLQPDTVTNIYLYNGTFEKSEAIVARNRMSDVSLINPGEKTIHPDAAMWFEENNQTVLKIKTGKEGTGLLGVSTLPKVGNFTAKSFADNMKHEGLLHILEARKKSGEDTKPAKKKYAKHVKTIFQVGNKHTEDFKTILNYPIELVPVNNPYTLKPGDSLSMQLLIDGNPASSQIVYAGYAGHQGKSKDGLPHDAYQVKTNTKGVVTIKLSKAGHWYFRSVYVTKSKEPDADYISQTASITFEIKN